MPDWIITDDVATSSTEDIEMSEMQDLALTQSHTQYLRICTGSLLVALACAHARACGLCMSCVCDCVRVRSYISLTSIFAVLLVAVSFL